MLGETIPHPRLLPFVVKQIVRRRTATLLTVMGVAVAMFLFGTVLSLQAGVRAATEATAKETVLVVYRKDRFCPFTSRLPEDYEAKIRRIDGVADVVPLQVVVNNCRASLDVVTFRGVRRDRFVDGEARRFDIADGTLTDWLRRSDAALLGRTLAERQR